LHLTGEYGSFIVVQKSKKRDVSQHFWVARHESPR